MAFDSNAVAAEFANGAFDRGISEEYFPSSPGNVDPQSHKVSATHNGKNAASTATTASESDNDSFHEDRPAEIEAILADVSSCDDSLANIEAPLADVESSLTTVISTIAAIQSALDTVKSTLAAVDVTMAVIDTQLFYASAPPARVAELAATNDMLRQQAIARINQHLDPRIRLSFTGQAPLVPEYTARREAAIEEMYERLKREELQCKEMVLDEGWIVKQEQEDA